MVLSNPDPHQADTLACRIYSEPLVSLSAEALGVPNINHHGLTGRRGGGFLGGSQQRKDFLHPLGMAVREKSRAGATTTVGQQPGVADLHSAALLDGLDERIDFHDLQPIGAYYSL
jgi:hypothetical protein